MTSIEFTLEKNKRKLHLLFQAKLEMYGSGNGKAKER